MPIFAKGETKQKLTILHYMKCAEALLTREQLYRAMIENGCMEFFDFQIAMNEMEEDGYLAAVPKRFGQGYALTDRGEELLTMFAETLPLSERERLSIYAHENRRRLKNENQLVSTMEEGPDGSYTVCLQAQSDEREELRITLHLASREMASRVRKNWSMETTGEEIYLHLLNTLLRNEENTQEV